jgi:hypothetical protein
VFDGVWVWERLFYGVIHDLKEKAFISKSTTTSLKVVDLKEPQLHMETQLPQNSHNSKEE